MAGDPLAVLLLLGLGVRILSLSAGLIPEVKEVVRVLNLDKAREVATRCLDLESGAAVRSHVEQFIGDLPGPRSRDGRQNG